MFTKILIWEGKRSIINHLLLDTHECNNNMTDLSTIPNAEGNSSSSNLKQFTIRSTFYGKISNVLDAPFHRELNQEKALETFLSLARLQTFISLTSLPTIDSAMLSVCAHFVKESRFKGIFSNTINSLDIRLFVQQSNLLHLFTFRSL